METADIIQIAILAVLACTLIAMLRQTIIQNRMYHAQLIRDRLDMYWRTYEPTTPEQIVEMKRNISDYIDPKIFEKKYKNDEEAMYRYITAMKLYEYLAFTQTIKKLKINDPLGNQWSKKWSTELSTQSEFIDVHESYRGYYPEFESEIDRLIRLHQE